MRKSAPSKAHVAPPASPAHAGLQLALSAGFSFACRSGDQGGLPTRILIAKWGENEVRGQNKSFKVGPQTLASLATEQKRRGWDTVSLDYEHQSVPGMKTYKPDPREYAAHGTVEVVEGQGIYYLANKYTPSGQQHAANYPDVSGVFVTDPKSGEVLAIHSVALCQHGCVEGAEFLDRIAASLLSAGGATATDVEQVLTYARDLAGLGDDATAKDVGAALEELVRTKNAPETAPTQSGGGGTGKDKSTSGKSTSQSQPKDKSMSDENKDNAAIAALTEQLKGLGTTVASLADTVKGIANTNVISAHNAAVDAEFLAASQLGKVVPDALKKKGEDGRYVVSAEIAKGTLEVIPATVATSFKGGSTAPVTAAQAQQQAKDIEAQVCASLGIADETWKKGHGVVCGSEPLHADKLQVAA